MNTNLKNLVNIVDSLPEGVTPKVTVLTTKKPRKTDLFANRIRGGSSRVRTGYGSHSTVSSTKNSALSDMN
jgi:hypothetical protein